jgi:hypothetical protein
MGIKETEFLGRWMKIFFTSPKSGNTYKIDCHWENNEWTPLVCKCEGFTRRGDCRHLLEAKKEVSGFPAPLETDIKMKRGFWLRCGICDGCDFMIRPVNKNTTENYINSFEYMCNKCGRMYKHDEI